MSRFDNVPELDHDRMMLRKWQDAVSLNGRLERRIAYHLGLYLERAGFALIYATDSEDTQRGPGGLKAGPLGVKGAMEFLFERDSLVYWNFRKEGHPTHWVQLVTGNGIDLLSDWSYTNGDPDGFDAAMDRFDVEDYA